MGINEKARSFKAAGFCYFIQQQASARAINLACGCCHHHEYLHHFVIQTV